MSIKDKLANFKEALANADEMFFSLGNAKTDYKYIRSILDIQGYWSGVSNRLYFDENLNLINVESRF